MSGSLVLKTQILNAQHSKNDTYSCRVPKIKVLYAWHLRNLPGTCKSNPKCPEVQEEHYERALQGMISYNIIQRLI